MKEDLEALQGALLRVLFAVEVVKAIGDKHDGTQFNAHAYNLRVRLKGDANLLADLVTERVRMEDEDS